MNYEYIERNSMFDFHTLPELFKHIQENIKTPSYLNYRNNKGREVIRNKMLLKCEKNVETVYMEDTS